MDEEGFQVGGLTKGHSVRLERLRKKLIYFVSSYDGFMLYERDPLTHRWLQVTMELAPKLHSGVPNGYRRQKKTVRV